MGEIGAMVARLEEEGIDLNRLIDDELESVGFLSFCSRSTASLSSRADVISGSQNELKSLLKSLEDQLRKIQEEENLPSSILDHDDSDDKGVKHIIVIDDEEETPKNDFSCQASMEEESPPVTLATSSASQNVVSKSVSCPSEPPKPTSVSSSVAMQTRPGNDRVGVPRPHVPGFAKSKMTEARPKCLVTEEGIIGYRTLKSPTESGAATVTSMVTLKSSQPTIPPQHLRSVATPSMPSASARTAIPDTRNDSREQTDNTPAEIPTPQGKRPPSPPKFEEGTRIIGKRADDLWYPGEIIKVIKDRYNQVKFRVKFDQGNRGLLRSNHIALESSPPLDVLHVGSRVVALRPRETADEAASWREATEGPYGKLDVLYAGIVAEICCPQNSNRFLIFFDDGFAQYLPLHKLHHVYHTGDKVWNEVAEHSQEFIQEYLEEFPNRPMVVLKASQWVKTEWRGKWLKAKVMQVDCSLVKMLFQVDNRSEWIYRGSTRLEPLYKALVDGKISKSRKNKRQKKMAQSTDEPYVDMSLTSPQFGFSLYSKTDPKGKKQEESEKNRNEPARQVQQQQPEGSARKSPGGQDTSSVSSSGEQNTLSKEPDTTAKSTGTTNNNNNNNNNMSSTTERTNKHTTIGTNTPINTTPNTSTHKSIGINTKRTAAPRNVLPNTQERTGSLTRVNNSCSVPDSTGVMGWSPSPLNHLDDSTASIIQASTMRKRTTAGLVTKTNYSHVGTNMVSIGADSTAVVTSKMVNNGAVSVMSPVMNKLKWEAPWKQQQKTHADSNILKKHMISNSKHDAAALIQERLQAEKKLLGVLKPMPEIKPLIPKPAILGPHKCGKHCGQTKQLDIKEQSKHNMLSVPLMLNWKREITKRHPRSKNEIYYRAPCNKRLRSIVDVGKYLTLTGTTNVTIDQFCFDSDISCTNTAINTKNMLLPDISHGTETVSISVVNEHDSSYPPPIDYVSDRILSEGVNIVTDPGFLACCDCTDNCQDKSKCSCAQLTISASAAVDGKEDIAVGYEYRKLMDCVPTGIYECNQNCACSSQCFNRVVQNGIHLRLQVFKTVDRGWGLRTLDDIPVGTFICTYSGQVMNEDMANKEGRDFGDEYLAELDHIEVVEKIKEGYESSVSDIEDDSVILKTLDTGSSECSDTGFMSDNNMSSDTDSVISDSSSLYEPVYQDTVTLKMKNRKKEAKKQSSQNTSPSKDNAVIIKEDGKTFRVSMADEKYVVASSSDTGSIVLRRISRPTEETAEQDNEQGAVPLHSDLCSDPPAMPCEPTVIDLTSSDEDEPLDFPRNANKKMYNDDDDDGGVKMSKPASSSEDPFDLCLDISTESTLSGDMDQGHVTDTTISSQDHEQLLPNTASNELCPDNSAITDTKSTKESDNTVKMDNEISGVVKEYMASSMDIENDKEIVMNCEPSLDNTNEDENTIRETVHSDDKSSEIKMHNDSKVSSDDDQGNHANHRLCDIQSEHSSHIESTNSCGEEVGKRSDAEVKEAPSSFGGQELEMNVNGAEGAAVNHAVQSSSASVVTHAPMSSSASSTDSNDHQSSPDISHDVQSSSTSSNISHAQSSLTSSTDINDHRSSPDISRDVQASASLDVNHANQSSLTSPDVNHANQSSSASSDVIHAHQSSSTSSDVNHANRSSSASSDVNRAHPSSSDVNHAHQTSSASLDVNHSNQSSASSDVNHAHQSSSASSDVNHAHQSSSASSDANHANQSSSASDVYHANQSSSVDNQDHHSSPDVIHDAQQSSSASSDISHGQTSSANNQDHESSPDVNHDPQSSSASSDESVPPLMSADDLSKLAAQLHQPHEEPPKLTKMECGVRLTDLKDTITKLKSRGVALDGVSPETVQESAPFLEDLPLFPETSSCEVDSFPPSPVSTESDSSVTDSDEKSSDTSFNHSVRVKSNSTGRRARRFIVTLQKNGAKRSASPRMTGDSPVKKPTTRSLFGEEHCYVIDAKAYGNCGRYLNHSCSPNLFVQNVFIDTHDLRFPRVAFFAQHNISAGSELTWDYMYEVGSVQDKELRCYCGSSQCRGRLL